MSKIFFFPNRFFFNRIVSSDILNVSNKHFWCSLAHYLPENWVFEPIRPSRCSEKSNFHAKNGLECIKNGRWGRIRHHRQRSCWKKNGFGRKEIDIFWHPTAGGAGKPRTVRYIFFTVFCVFITVIVNFYIPGVYFINTFDQTFHF